ncbi:EutP/PduV family microcompartment system protein [Levilactobacillus angrenensis]|uniref:EutP/PduV family microcompartment system protein n=1 Tax=Levilactobacillus angrenensis TaxID=2486020 RepID=A0ABW1UBL3_9LACO|nr:EutP/PduV family microcompartment system protein [Levilactobacillus angrenensis]
MKKPIFIGAVACGKTTLCQRLLGQAIAYKKTQVVEFYKHNRMIDTPGEFMEHREYYSALTVTAVDADVIVLVQSVTDHRQTFSPGFGSMFPKDKIGIVTKIDLAEDPADIDWAVDQLKAAGASQIFCVSAKTNTGMTAITDYLEITEA